MKNSTAKIMKYTSIYGVILGIILIMWLTFDYVMGYYGQNKIMSNFNYLARIAGVFICTLIYRNKSCGGYISLGKAFIFGWLTFIVAMIVLEIFVCLLVNVVDPEYLVVKAGLMTKQLTDVGMQSQPIGGIINLAMYMEHPVWAVIMALLGGGFVGLFVSLLSALILRRDENKPTYRKRSLRIRS